MKPEDVRPGMAALVWPARGQPRGVALRGETLAAHEDGSWLVRLESGAAARYFPYELEPDSAPRRKTRRLAAVCYVLEEDVAQIKEELEHALRLIEVSAELEGTPSIVLGEVSVALPTMEEDARAHKLLMEQAGENTDA